MPNRIRVLLPVRPDNDCSEPTRILDALFARETVSVLRLFVYRPAELDLYSPEMFAAVPGIRRLDAEELDAAVKATRIHCQALVHAGFHVESAVIAGFPIDKVVEEAIVWNADLVLIHVRHELSDENRIGRIAGALIDSSPVPVLAYRTLGKTIATRIAVHIDLDDQSENAVQWAAAFAERHNAEVNLVHVEVPHLWSHHRTDDEVQRALGVLADGAGRPMRTHCESAPSIADGLSAVVAREKCDLVIISAHPRFAPAILGSTDRRIVRQCDVPVVLIPRETRNDPREFRKRM